ncbi:DUF2975 domain-containing protein [Winogradskyella sp. PAMC22761]|nr:DUF2975 domain-containing protein [Winogradskyella sp. PAMC22761]
MKKIRYSIILLFLALVVSIVGNLTISTLALFFDTYILHLQQGKPSLATQGVFLAKALALLIFVYGVFTLISNLKIFATGDFFNSKLVTTYHKAGSLFLFSGIIGIVISLISIFFMMNYGDIHNQIYLNIDSKGLYILLMILGLFFRLFSAVLKKGNIIQQENDLTI